MLENMTKCEMPHSFLPFNLKEIVWTQGVSLVFKSILKGHANVNVMTQSCNRYSCNLSYDSTEDFPPKRPQNNENRRYEITELDISRKTYRR